MRMFLAILLLCLCLGCGGNVPLGENNAENGNGNGNGNGENIPIPITITITDPPDELVYVSIHSSKPATEANFIAGADFIGNTSEPLVNKDGTTYAGGNNVYIVLEIDEEDYYISKISYTLTPGSRTINFPANFDGFIP